MNAHVGDIIDGNDPKVSHGGKLLREFVTSGHYTLANSTNTVVNGPFTRVDPGNDDKQSALDLCIISSSLFPYVESLTIAKNQSFTPFRPLSKSNVKYSDHYSLLLVFKGIPLGKATVSGGEQLAQWNTNRDGGWNLYKELTTNNSAFHEIAKCSDSNPEKIEKKLNNELNKIKFEAFGKVTYKNKSHADKNLAKLQVRKAALFSNNSLDDETKKDEIGAVEKEIASTVIDQQRESLRKDIACLQNTKMKRGKCSCTV